jgi:hypothetical protein
MGDLYLPILGSLGTPIEYTDQDTTTLIRSMHPKL